MFTKECPDTETTKAPKGRLRRLLPVGLVVLAMVAVFASGLHKHLSLETLVRHRMAIDAFISAHGLGAVAVFMAIYIAAVALSIPGASLLTISSGILFGAAVGGTASAIAATTGASLVFLIARTACGETLTRRIGPRLTKIANGFRDDAFSYLLFLRLVPAFPFFIVNIAPALVGVSLTTFLAATAVGVVPATFAFAFLGSGLDSVLAAQGATFRACLASGATDCKLALDLGMIVTPQLLCAFAALGVIALIPIAVKRYKARTTRRTALS